MSKQTIYYGDVLEHALNFGIASSSIRYCLPEYIVLSVVKWFQKDIDDEPKCRCMESMKHGDGIIAFYCMVCTLKNGVGNRILV